MICCSIIRGIEIEPQWTCVWASSSSLWGSTAEALNSEEKEKTEPKALLSHACFLGLVPLVSNALKIIILIKMLSNSLSIIPRCFHWTRRRAKCTCLSASLSTIVLMAIYCGFLLVPLSPSPRRVQDSQRDQLQTTILWVTAGSRIAWLERCWSIEKKTSLCSLISFAPSPVASLTFFHFGICRSTKPGEATLLYWSLMTHRSFRGTVLDQGWL